MTQTLTLTNAGRAAIVNAQHDGTNAVTVTQVGLTASNFALDPALTALPDEFKRLASISGGATTADTIHVTATDASADIYVLKGVGLYLTDGTLFAVYAQADPIISKAADALGLITFDVQFVNMGGVSVEFGDANFFNPQATVDVKGVVELATSAETTAKTDTARAVTPKGLWDAFSAWLAAAMINVWTSVNDGAGSGLDADLLDGQEGAYYADIPTRLGYTPLNKAGDTVSGLLRLDNDLMFGRSDQDTAYFIRPNVAGKKKFGFTADGGNDLELVILHTTALQRSGYTIWDAATDGAGSGLDADMLDGQEGAYYADIPTRLGYTPLNKAGDTVSGLLRLDNDLMFGRSDQDTAYFIRPNVAGKKKFGFTADDGNDLELVILHTTALQRSGYTIWDAATDGAGSGLDADMLDGQEGAYYADIPTRLGYTPLNQTAYTAADVLAKMATVDGAGSGLDADRLDGQEGAYYADIPTRLGYTPLNQTAYTAADVLAKMATVDGAGSGLDADRLDGQEGAYYADIPTRLGYTPLNKAGDTVSGLLRLDNDLMFGRSDQDTAYFIRPNVAGKKKFGFTADGGNDLELVILHTTALQRSGYTIWDAATDGAGSGLDADLLDGQEGSYYTNVVARLGYTPLDQTAYTAADVLAKMATVDGAGSGLDADLLDGKAGTAYVEKANIMTDFAAMMALVWNGAFGPNSFRLGGLLVQMGIANTVNGNDVATVTFPTAFSAAPFVIPIRRTSGAITNADSGVGIEGTPTTTIVKLRNTTAGTTVDIMWIAIGPA